MSLPSRSFRCPTVKSSSDLRLTEESLIWRPKCEFVFGGTLITAAVSTQLPAVAVCGVPFRDSAFGVASPPYPWTPYQCRHTKADPSRSTDLLDESFRPVPPHQVDF